MGSTPILLRQERQRCRNSRVAAAPGRHVEAAAAQEAEMALPQRMVGEAAQLERQRAFAYFGP